MLPPCPKHKLRIAEIPSGRGQIVVQRMIMRIFAFLGRHRRWTALGVTVLLIGSVIIFVLPPTIRWGIEKWLESHGRLEAQVENVDFNLFSGNLVVHSLLAERNGEGGFRWARAALEIPFLRLVKKRIIFDNLSFTKARFSIVREKNGDLYVAGFRFKKAAVQSAPQQDESEWEIGFGNINLDHVSIRYRTPKFEREILIRSAHVDAMHSWNPSASGSFSAELAVGGGIIAIEGSAQPYGPQASVKAQLDVRQVALDFAGPWMNSLEIKDVAGTFAANGSFSVILGERTTASWEGNLVLDGVTGGMAQVDLRPFSATWEGSAYVALPTATTQAPHFTADGTITAKSPEVKVKARGLAAGADNLRIQGEFRHDTEKVPEDTGFLFVGEVQAEGLRISRTAETSALVQVQRLTAERLHIAGSDRIGVESATLVQSLFLERPADAPAADNLTHVLRLTELVLRDIQMGLDEQHLSLGTAVFQGAQGNLVRGEQGRFTFLERLSGQAQASSASRPSGQTPPDEAVWTWAVGEARIGSDSGIRFIDRSVTPAVDMEVSNIDLRLENLNSASSDPATIELKAQIGDYASIQANGTILPLAEKISMDIKGEVAQFMLPQVRGYARQRIGYTIQSGQLYADFHLLVEQSQMNSEIKLFIRKLELERLSEDDTGPMEEQLGMPLNAALDLLRNRAGDIRLRLPVTGTLAKPDLGMGDVIAKALRSATLTALKTAALSYFAPLGAAYVAGKLLGKAMALRLNPIDFNAAQAQLDQSDRQYLDQVAEKLEDRPEAQLRICGKATAQDRLALAEKRKNEDDDAKKNNAPIISDDRLLDLARERAENTRNYLLERGIGSERLLICTPEIALDGEAQPQVELGI
jgi:outer membrane protein OmpA-like peptidoglycan-associated protein